MAVVQKNVEFVRVVCICKTPWKIFARKFDCNESLGLLFIYLFISLNVSSRTLREYFSYCVKIHILMGQCLMTCTHHQILFGYLNREGWDGMGM
jgi:hypothetical protein